MNTITIKQEPVWNQQTITTQNTELSDYISRQGLSLNLQQFLKFNPDTIKRESLVENSPLNNNSATPDGSENSQENSLLEEMKQPDIEIDASGKIKKKRKYKKKPPKPKPPKPGQVHIATALDGTILFCCPECQMAYPDKSNLEQHLTVHKIERRYICDLCGAGLKRKEHLERHKLGHSPERPYICSVCMKGFKRKEHLNLHFVIHSGDKNEVLVLKLNLILLITLLNIFGFFLQICGECGKGFYRKDHLRKHAKSHAAKRLKEELSAQAAAATLSAASNMDTSTQSSDNTIMSSGEIQLQQQQPINNMSTTQSTLGVGESQTICLPGVTIHVSFNIIID